MPDLNTAEHQACWVLLSASADHTHKSIDKVLDDSSLVEARQLNQQQPSALLQHRPQIQPPWCTRNCALLLIGELRCLSRSGPFLKRLSQQTDLFIVTTASYSDCARKFTTPDRLLVVDEVPSELKRDRSLPVGSMKQWHKLNLALHLVQQAEKSRGKRYSQLLKLRSDYFYAHPKQLLREVVNVCLQADAGLVGASDKVFGGPRDLMMLFKGFFQGIEAWFDKREQHYWPINLQQVLASDDAVKWYGMNWPVELIGRPETTEEWRKYLKEGGDALATALTQFQSGPDVAFHRLFEGHPRFASEISFARFLNFNGIPFQDCYSLRGFLYSDRSTCP